MARTRKDAMDELIRKEDVSEVKPDTTDLGIVEVADEPAANVSGESTVLVEAMSLIKALQEKVDRLENPPVEEPVLGKKLDLSKPYMKHRGAGAVTYEQFGQKYDGAMRLIE